MFPSSRPVYILSVVQCTVYSVHCTAASVVRALNFPWETTLGGRAVSWLGWAWTRGNILHTSHYIVNTAPFVTLLYGIYQQYLHISHSIISLSSSHTRTQRDKQVSIRQQVIFCISYVTASRQCSSDMMVSVAVRGSGRVIIVITIIISLSAAGRVSDCRQSNSRVACIISSSHHHQHYPQQSASSRLPRVGVTIVTLVTIVTTPWSPTPRGWAAGAGS